jgi:hypothetical protein
MEYDYRRGFGLMTVFIVLFETARDYALRFTVTHTHTLVSTVTFSQPFLDSGFQWWMFPFFWVPELSAASATSFSQQQLTMTELQQSSN